ncbi:uncharacterized protein KY384_007355 [Bacidia gigantensis]|uniref:uncharacterized protein n=1 Tax=Bacidia gigantensis TaxID=2732470 RepID=UPI001D0553AA|nr:uncharacterized protein KY384_007355 [Bacidia gigantensis]KAG8528437.1 hypothetical protein KY384_007355 [Bacidia gigantensis]
MSSAASDTSYAAFKASLNAPTSRIYAQVPSSQYFSTGNEYLNSLDTTDSFHRAVGMRHFADSDFFNPGSDPRFEAELQASILGQNEEKVNEHLDRSLKKVHVMVKEGKEAMRDGGKVLRRRCRRANLKEETYEKTTGEGETRKICQGQEQAFTRPRREPDPEKRHSALIRDIVELLDADEVKEGLITEKIRRSVIEAMESRIGT